MAETEERKICLSTSRTDTGRVYLLFVLPLTPTEIGLEVVLAIPSAIGSAVARSATEPRTDGFQEQVTVKLEPAPDPVMFDAVKLEMVATLDVGFARVSRIGIE